MLNFETLVSTERAGAVAPVEGAAADGGAAAGDAAATVSGAATKAEAESTPVVATASASAAAAAAAAVASADDVAVDFGAGDGTVVPVTRCRSDKLMGKPWKDTTEEIRGESARAEGAVGSQPGWRLRSLLAKSNDDLRQEVFVMQLWTSMSAIMAKMERPLPLKCYQIITTGARTGLIETLIESTSLDGLIEAHGAHNLKDHFEMQYMHDPSMKARAINNFVESLAAQSVATYMLAVKDRHNGNVMISSDGSIFNIDFGFLLGIATGFFPPGTNTRLAMEEVRCAVLSIAAFS